MFQRRLKLEPEGFRAESVGARGEVAASYRIHVHQAGCKMLEVLDLQSQLQHDKQSRTHAPTVASRASSFRGGGWERGTKDQGKESGRDGGT